MPFVKTPANVIGAGIDASGVSAIRAMWNLKSALESAKLGNRDPLKQVVRDFVRSGLGPTLSMIVSAMFDPDDFIGEYPVNAKEQELYACNGQRQTQSVSVASGFHLTISEQLAYLSSA